MSSEKLKHCYDVYHEFRAKFLERHPDATVNIYGSVVYGACFNDSPCDISVEFNKDNRTSEQILSDVSEFIRVEMPDRFEIANSSKQIKSPKTLSKKNKTAGGMGANLTRLTLESKGPIKAYFNFTSCVMADSYKTSFLLRAYMQLDERAKILAFCFRYMAKVNTYIRLVLAP
jgi:predicted nucleotidyltransferase